MKLAVIASLIASAAAFAPAKQTGVSSTLRAEAFSDELGVQPPLGLYDPLGILKKGDEPLDQERFDELRFLEIKHGRVAMLGVVGYLVTYAGVRLPGLEDIPAGWAAWKALPGEVWIQMIATWATMEAANKVQPGKTSEFPGDFRNGFIDFGWDKQSDAWKAKKRTVEINQGRAAMMGIAGLMVHDAIGNVNEILPY